MKKVFDCIWGNGNPTNFKITNDPEFFENVSCQQFIITERNTKRSELAGGTLFD